jgi:hypothetical protein
MPGRMILHLVNLTSEASWRAPLDELIRVGPYEVKLRLPSQLAKPTARLLVSNVAIPKSVQMGTAAIRVESILDHEVVLVE